MRVWAVLVLCLWVTNAAAFPMAERHQSKLMTKQELRRLALILLIERLQHMEKIPPLQLQVVMLGKALFETNLNKLIP